MTESTPSASDLKKPASLHRPAIEAPEEELQPDSFRSLSPAQKRFHILFYVTASLTGLVTVQLIWQIAILTAR